MQFRNVLVVAIVPCLVLAGTAGTASLARGESASRKYLGATRNPVSRVVELLQELTTRTEADGKAEQELYDKFVCWANSMIQQKTKSNSAARTRVSYLETYISDLNAGRIELTTERVDLEKDIKTITDDKEVAEQARLAGSQDFAMAKDEMDQAIAALAKAIEVLHVATQNHTDGVLLRFSTGLNQGYAARAKEAAALAHAVELGKRVLTKGDAVFLSRLLTAEVPERAPWKKLNREATFKMSYKARSFKIQSVLAKLLETFTLQLQEAVTKEKEEVKQHGTLMNAKGEQLSAAEQALQKMEKETAARTLSLDDATDEKTSLSQQVTDDEGYVSSVGTALAAKRTEWQARQKLRTGELAAIQKAIAILHNDDARDLFKRSYVSQGYLFMQETSMQTGHLKRAVEVLQTAAQKTHSMRLNAVAATAEVGDFTEVIGHIDSMLELLGSEETEDLEKKEECEEERLTATREAKLLSRAVDEHTDTIAAHRERIDEVVAERKEVEERILKIKADLADILDQRNKDHQEYQTAKKDDEDAAALVQNSKDVLQTFYQENNLMFVQGREQPYISVAGEAPPPPPATWEGSYGGKVEESTGIIAIMSMIHDDIMKDIEQADKTDAASDALYKKSKNNLELERDGLRDRVGELNDAEFTETSGVDANEVDRKNRKQELVLLIKKMADAKPACDFLLVNFKLRASNRQIEVDGLRKAKAILTGAKFDGLPDPNRELKPGDASLLQGHLRAGRKFNKHSSK